MEDLQHILPDQIRQLSGRKVYVVLISLVALFGGICLILTLMIVVRSVQNSGNGDTVISFALKDGGKFPSVPPGVCATAECLKTAAWMTDNMDRTASPCDDFYQYACGGWMEKKEIPPSTSYYSVNSELNAANDDKMHALIQSTHSSSETERKVKDFYQSCLHDYGRMEDGGKEVIDIVRNKFGGWYALDPDNWDSAQWDATSALTSAISEYLVDALIGIDVYPNRQNSSQNIITLKGAYLGMYSNYYLDDDKVHVQSTYKKFMKDIGRLLLRDANVTMNNSKRESVLDTFVEDAYYQEFQIAQGINIKRRQPGYWNSPITTIAEFSRNYTQIDWLAILKGYYGQDINGQTKLYVRNLPYFDLIEELLKNETTNRNRILNNFLVWSFVDTYAHQLSWEYRMTASGLNEEFRGPSDMIPTWKQCLQMVEDRMGSALAAEFILQHVGEGNRKQVASLFSQMRKVFPDVLRESRWVDNVTLTRSIEKLGKLESLIGFPESHFNRTFLENLHNELVINKSFSYFKNLMNTYAFTKKLKRMQLDAGDKYYLWRYVIDTGSFSSTVRYYWRSHRMLVPAGAMQFPLLNPQHPGVLTTAALGNRMAQAMYYSISNIGRYQWHNGSYFDWWTATAYAKYILARGCFRDYARSLEVGPYLIRGENVTLNLRTYSADIIMNELVGVKVAYKTFKKYYSEANANYKIPLGVGLTEDQTFFLSYAQSRCTKRVDMMQYNRIRAGYVPAKERVNSVLVHMKEFSTTFQCPTFSFMANASNCEYF